MGLDTTHDCFHGPYSKFMRWRYAIAEAAGFHALCYATGGTAWSVEPDSLCQQDWARCARENPPLYALLNHSDCDGCIDVPDLLPLADALEALLPNVPQAGEHKASGWWWCSEDRMPERTRAFIDGLRAAAAAGEKVEFH